MCSAPAIPRCSPASSRGIISSYQALDPAVVADDDGERLPLADLHALVERAFTP